jgi:hypothetical protein
LRRECLDFIIPLTEDHLQRLLHEWAAHYIIPNPDDFRVLMRFEATSETGYRHG